LTLSLDRSAIITGLAELMSDDENALLGCTFASLGVRGARLSARATGAGSIRAAARVTNAIYRIFPSPLKLE